MNHVIIINLLGIDGITKRHESNFSLSEVREMNLDDTAVSSAGSKSLQEAFCRHEELLISNLFAFLSQKEIKLTYVQYLLQLNYCAVKILMSLGQKL